MFMDRKDRTSKINEIQVEKPRLPVSFGDFKEFLIKE
jgi:hypothetical protein